jgi:hypothetical protein
MRAAGAGTAAAGYDAKPSAIVMAANPVIRVRLPVPPRPSARYGSSSQK